MNYFNTFISVSPDTSARTGTTPPERGGKKSIAVLEYEIISCEPYMHMQEEVQFMVHVQRQGISSAELKTSHPRLWQEFFSKSKACMRTSPLPKSYGWGLHFNPEGKVGLIAMESPEYKRLSGDGNIEQVYAMRSRRA